VLLLHAYLTGVARAADAGGPRVPIVVAATGISRGTALRSDELRMVRMPRAYAPPGAFGTIGQAAGRVALADLSKGEAVTRTRLARVRAGPVASLIPEGLRAFAVPTSLPVGVVAAGDLVDVLATYSSGQPHTETVVSGVEVLFVLDGAGGSGLGASGGPSAGGSNGSALDAGAATSDAGTLILLVSADQEGRLAYARAFADLAVAIEPAGSAISPET
jgi:Flp pilus assembly protein CpaB